MKELKSFDDIISYENGFKSLTGNRVVLDFYANWCGPCKVATPAVEKISDEFPDTDFYKIDVDEFPELAEIFDVTSIPTFVVITPEGKFTIRMGWEGEEKFKKFIESITN